MEKALNLRLFTKSCDHPQWRSDYVKSDQPERTGSNSAENLLFSIFLFFFFFVLFCLLICFAFFCFVFFFVFKYIPK